MVHLGAKVGLGVGIDDMDDYVSSNDLGTAVLLRAMAGTGIARFVQASSMVVYGEGCYTCEVHGPVSPGPRTPKALSQGRFEPPCLVCGVDLAPGLVGEESPMGPRNTYAAYNVGSGVVSTVGDLARALSSSRNGRDPVMTGDFRLGDVRHITASSAKIQNELGWHATVSLAEGVTGLTFG